MKFKSAIIDVKQLHQNLDDPNLILLDASFKKLGNKVVAHPDLQIPTARFMDLKGSFSEPGAEFPNTCPNPKHFSEAAQNLGINQDSIIVCYDNLGIYTAPRAWWLFKTMGHQKVYVLNGGLNEWIAQGYRTEAIPENNTYDPGNFNANFQANEMTNIEQVERNLEQNTFLVLDARSKGRFDGIDPEPRAGISSGHIQNALSLPFTEVLSEGKFKSKNELKQIFDSMNLKDQKLVFSCGSGITACIILLAATEVIKNEKSMFDGSWTEWASSLPHKIIKA